MVAEESWPARKGDPTARSQRVLSRERTLVTVACTQDKGSLEVPLSFFIPVVSQEFWSPQASPAALPTHFCRLHTFRCLRPRVPVHSMIAGVALQGPCNKENKYKKFKCKVIVRHLH